MAKELIIGGISNYGFDKVKLWINSAKKSGFKGDIVLLATNVYKADIDKMTEAGAKVIPYGYQDAEGNYVTHHQMPPHVERFFHIWNFLRECEEEYDFVVATDVRDVVFQINPSGFLTSDDHCDFIAAGEGLAYEDEPWGNTNYLQTFGAFFHNIIKSTEIYNVGVMAGRHEVVRDIMLMILQLSINRPINVVDQAVYNFILDTGIFKARTEFFGNNSGWTCNLGTTLAAIQSGAGDIGQKNDPTAQIMYKTKYMYDQPEIKDDGTVCNSHGIPFYIVHQYDRVAGLTEKMEAKYND